MSGREDPPERPNEDVRQEREGPAGRPNGGVRQRRTPYDWAHQIVIPLLLPLVVLGIGLYFTLSQNQTQRDIGQQRADAQLTIENERGQEEALQAYLGVMENLMFDGSLLDSEEDDEVRTLARAQTQTVLERIETPDRKGRLVQFLYDSRLIDDPDRDTEGRPPAPTDSPIIPLRRVDLSESNLRGARLAGANLADADLSAADLEGADLEGANLCSADLSNADMRPGSLAEANLSGANLESTELTLNDMRDATASFAKLEQANLFFVGELVSFVKPATTEDIRSGIVQEQETGAFGFVEC